MKINNVALINKINFSGTKNIYAHNPALENSNSKTVVEKNKNKNGAECAVNYMKVVDKDNRRLREIRYSARYNLFDAIKFKKEGAKDIVKDRLTIYLDNNGEPCGFYLINEDKDGHIHTSMYTQYSNHGIKVFGVDKNNKIYTLSKKQEEEQIRFSFEYVNNVLKEAKQGGLLPR